MFVIGCNGQDLAPDFFFGEAFLLCKKFNQIACNPLAGADVSCDEECKRFYKAVLLVTVENVVVVDLLNFFVGC